MNKLRQTEEDYELWRRVIDSVIEECRWELDKLREYDLTGEA